MAKKEVKSQKRLNGEGSKIFTHRSGRKYAQVTAGKKPDGRPRVITVYGKDDNEVLRKRAELLARYHKGLLVEPSRFTFREFTEQWLALKETQVSAKRVEIDRNYIRHALDVLGDLPLQKITPAHIRELHLRLAEKKQRKGKEPKTRNSRRTVPMPPSLVEVLKEWRDSPRRRRRPPRFGRSITWCSPPPSAPPSTRTTSIGP